MNGNLKRLLFGLLAALSATAAQAENGNGFSVIFSGGMHLGGITETEPIDAVSSASTWGGHGGVHAEMDIAGHFIETGIDYAYLEKDLEYKDADSDIDGRRSFTAHGIALPIMYNFHLFKSERGEGRLIVGAGLCGYLFPYQKIEDSGTVSGSDSKNWAAGPCIRIGYHPLGIRNTYFPGIYLNLFRSFNRFYTVDYEDAEAGELAILGFGVSLKMKP